MGTSEPVLSTYYEAGTVLNCFMSIITFGIQNSALGRTAQISCYRPGKQGLESYP